jgi:sialate O-acetylesterase
MNIFLKPFVKCASVCVLLYAVALPLRGAVKPSALFGDNAVLQAGVDVPVWGTARQGEVVTVEFQGRKKSVTAKDGKWMVHLRRLKPGGPFDLIIAGGDSLTFTNVLVGEVWLCSGQSNMEVGLGAAHNAKEELPKATYPNLRLFVVSQSTAFVPQDAVTPNPSNDLHGHWQICTPETILKDGTWPAYPGFSAVAYFFGRELQGTTGQPVGLIGSYFGGTLVSSWMSLDALKKNPEFTHRISEYESAMARFKSDGSRSNEEQKNIPSVLFNAMIQPLVPYALKGVIWYQGEQNAAAPDGYANAFKCMVTDWRRRWGLGDFPFLFVQIAGYHAPQTNASEGGWALLREQQMKSLSLRKTGMASAMDLGAPFDVHPRDKLDVGHRLALAAKHVAYGQELVYSGPIYDSMKIQGDKIRISFRHVGGGLKVGLPPWTPSGKLPPTPTRLTGFAIAGADRNWVWADAFIERDRVVVSSLQVRNPVAVRYGWASFPVCNLYNAEGLPASSFRTDDWREP